MFLPQSFFTDKCVLVSLDFSSSHCGRRNGSIRYCNMKISLFNGVSILHHFHSVQMFLWNNYWINIIPSRVQLGFRFPHVIVQKKSIQDIVSNQTLRLFLFFFEDAIIMGFYLYLIGCFDIIGKIIQ